MNYNDLAEALNQFEGNSVLVTCRPEILDFTDKNASNELIISGKEGHEIILVLKDETLPIISSMLSISIFSKGWKILTWNWKALSTYIRFKTGKSYEVNGAIIDFKVLENYSGLKTVAPKNLAEALQRLKNLIKNDYWRQSEPIYKNIHLPLLTTVLPHLESIGILDVEIQAKVHACYDIEGQQNGRLLCTKAFDKGYVPHAMGDQIKAVLKPLRQDQLFMSFDFKGMEVAVLAHLSKDVGLSEMYVKSDVYSALYEKLTGQKSQGLQDRDFAKKCFLPTIYGQSARALSQRCGVAIDLAELVVERISSSFRASLVFVTQCESMVREHGFAQDVFGRRRANFDAGKEYLARNFAVQSPAATLCLEKLIDLHVALYKKADIAYTVHDGYVVYAKKDNWKQIYSICHKVLTAESRLSPGLCMKVTCRAGRNLNDLKPIGHKE